MDLSILLTASVVANLFFVWKIMRMHRLLRNAVLLFHRISQGEAKIDREGNVVHINKEA